MRWHSSEPPAWWVFVEWVSAIALAVAVVAVGVLAATYPSAASGKALGVGFTGVAVALSGIFLAPDTWRATVASMRTTTTSEASEQWEQHLHVERSSPIWLPRRVRNLLMLGWALVLLATIVRVLVEIY